MKQKHHKKHQSTKLSEEKVVQKQGFKKKSLVKYLLWLVVSIIVIYILTGVGFAIAFYKYHKEGKTIKTASIIYPLPAAWVGFRPILAKDYLQQLDYVKRFYEKSAQPLPDSKELHAQILSQLIDTKLIKQEAKKNKITVSKNEIDDTYKKIVEQANGETELKKILTEMYGMNDKEFKSLVTDQVLTQKFQNELFVQIKARHILIKDESKAKEALDKVKVGGNFEELAKQYSEDTATKDNGGDLGWFGKGQMVKEFEDAAFKLALNQVSQELVKSNFGYHIIRVDEKKGTIDQSYTDWVNEIKTKVKIRKWINW